jgi:hypothetical protein
VEELKKFKGEEGYIKNDYKDNELLLSANGDYLSIYEPFIFHERTSMQVYFKVLVVYCGSSKIYI